VTRRPVMSPAALTTLFETSTTTDVPTACAALGIGVNLGYDLIRRDDFPVRVFRLGRRLVVPTADLMATLGRASSRTPAEQAQGTLVKPLRMIPDRGQGVSS
jgi:hypothetical protein